MAFRFNWPEFDDEFYVEAKSQLETAMNKGNKPSVIVDHITVKELHMGTQVNRDYLSERPLPIAHHDTHLHNSLQN